MEAPKRKHVIKINAHADTQADLIEALNQIIFDISRDREEGIILNSVSACNGSGYSWQMEIHPDQTAENYKKQIQEYLAANKDCRIVGQRLQGIGYALKNFCAFCLVILVVANYYVFAPR